MICSVDVTSLEADSMCLIHEVSDGTGGLVVPLVNVGCQMCPSLGWVISILLGVLIS